MRRWIRSLFVRPARAARRVAVVLAAVLLVAGTWHHGEFCFAAGTPLLTPNGGAKPIEEFVAGELILSRDEWDVEGPVEPKVVEEVFVRFGGVLCLSAGGQTIKTTHAHPFWVVGKGWLPAKEIQVGDWLLGHDGQKTQVDAITEGEWETLYNLRVADHHTYFVGCDEWGFSLWAHNNCTKDEFVQALRNLNAEKIKADGGKGDGYGLTNKTIGRIWASLMKAQAADGVSGDRLVGEKSAGHLLNHLLDPAVRTDQGRTGRSEVAEQRALDLLVKELHLPEPNQRANWVEAPSDRSPPVADAVMEDLVWNRNLEAGDTRVSDVEGQRQVKLQVDELNRIIAEGYDPKNPRNDPAANWAELRSRLQMYENAANEPGKYPEAVRFVEGNAEISRDARADARREARAEGIGLKGQAALHRLDAGLGGRADRMAEFGDKKVNEVLGGNVRRLRQQILSLSPDKIPFFKGFFAQG